MKRIVYGTTNPAKVAQLRDILAPAGFEVRSLADFDALNPVDEDGVTVEENARKKALYYATALKETVLSMDVGLYFDSLPDDQQPGLHVRRFQGKERATDEEMIAYYTGMASRLGDTIPGYWRYGFALATPDGWCVTFTHDTPRRFVAQPSSTRIEGYPLEAIQIDPESGLYISEMSQAARAAFWRQSIGEPLLVFLKKNVII